MASTRLALPPSHVPLFDDAEGSKPGTLHPAWRAFFQGVFFRLGGSTDNLAIALLAALSAVPNTTEIVAAGGLQFGGSLADNIPVALYAFVGPVAGLPTDKTVGDWAYATDGRKAGEGAGSGTGLPVWWDGTNWKAVDTGATAAA